MITDATNRQRRPPGPRGCSHPGLVTRLVPRIGVAETKCDRCGEVLFMFCTEARRARPRGPRP